MGANRMTKQCRNRHYVNLVCAALTQCPRKAGPEVDGVVLSVGETGDRVAKATAPK